MRLKVSNIYGKGLQLRPGEELWLFDMDGIVKHEKAEKEVEQSLREKIRSGEIAPFGIDEDKGCALFLIVQDKTRILVNRTSTISNALAIARRAESVK